MSEVTKKKKHQRKREQELKEETKSVELTPAEAAVTVLASCQGTGGRACYCSVAVICLREVQSKLVQTAQPGSASWVNMQLRRGLHTTDSPWPPLQSVLCWNAEPSTISKPSGLCMRVCESVCLSKLNSFSLRKLFHNSVKKFCIYAACFTMSPCLCTQ